MKFFSIIRTFDKSQWTRFLTYLELYYKPHGLVCKVANWIDTKSIWRSSNDQNYNVELLSSKIPFEVNAQTLSNTFSILGNVAEEYLGWIVWKDSGNLKISNQLLGLAQKSLSDQYLKTQKEVLKKSDTKVISIWDEHYKMLSYFNDYYFGISASENSYFHEFNELIESFIKSTATIAQLLMVEVKNREILLSESWSHHTEYFNMLYQPNTELKHITDQLILMNQYGDENAYSFLIKELMSDEAEKFSRHVRYCIVSYCINFLTRVIRKGASNRGQELLDLYEYALDQGIFTLNDNMTLKKYINIINLASKLENFEWSRKIVDKWSKKVDENNAKTIAKFGHATIDFQQKKYESVVETLSQMKSSNFIHRLRSRWLLLIAQYEISKDHVEVLKVQVDNFRRFVTSNESKINNTTYEGIKVSIKILNMLLNRKNQKEIEEFYRNTKYVFERKWISEKIKNPV